MARHIQCEGCYYADDLYTVTGGRCCWKCKRVGLGDDDMYKSEEERRLQLALLGFGTVRIKGDDHA